MVDGEHSSNQETPSHIRDTQNAETYYAPQSTSIFQWIPWLVGGGALSMLTFCAVILFGVVLVSGALNAYLAWQLNPIEIVVTRPDPANVSTNLASPRLLSVALENAVETEPELLVEQSTTESPAQEPELNAHGNNDNPQAVAQASIQSTEPNNTNDAIQAPSTDSSTAIENYDTANSEVSANVDSTTTSSTDTAIDPGTIDNNDSAIGNNTTAPDDRMADSTQVTVPNPSSNPDNTIKSEAAPKPDAPPASNNQYELIPIPGGQDDRPSYEHGDHNLKLRGWVPDDATPELQDVSGATAGDPPRLGNIFQPDFVGIYRVRQWDWGCNCRAEGTETIPNNGNRSILAAIRTAPGQDVKIPPRNADIYNVNKKYYAVVLHASEDSLTFVYDRKGNVVSAYAIHYEGLNVDPNLLEAFRNSPKDKLPGLTLDTPVGTANGELIVAVRDKGAFMDIRTRKDWWR